MALLVDQLRPQDRLAIVVYAGAAGVVLETVSGDQKAEAHRALSALEAGGSTAGAEGIELAYQLARQQFVPDGHNRVILVTDGDFNVGPSSPGLIRRTTHATVIEEALRPDDMPGERWRRCSLPELAQKLLVVSARLDWETRTVAGTFQGDGIVTRTQTFQKFFAQDELRDWIQAVTGRPCVAAAPGVFYVFRETSDEQTFVAMSST